MEAFFFTPHKSISKVNSCQHHRFLCVSYGKLIPPPPKKKKMLGRKRVTWLLLPRSCLAAVHNQFLEGKRKKWHVEKIKKKDKRHTRVAVWKVLLPTRLNKQSTAPKMPSPNLLALQHRAYESQHTHQKPAHKQWGTLIPCIVLTILATVTVLLRLYTRVYIIHAPGTDDAVILLSLLLSWAVCGLTAAMVAHGIGAYVWTSQLDLLPHNAKLVLAWNCVYVLLLYVTKASVLMQYLRIFAGNGTRGLTYLLLCCLLPPALYGIFGAIFLCRPVAKLWHVGLDGHCGSLRTYFLVTTSLNIVLDFCVLLLPLPKIWTLRLPRRQKIGLLLVFLLGFL